MTCEQRRRLWELAAVLLLVGFGLGLRLGVIDRWQYGGADTYGYLKLADELWAHGRYALAPEPEPLHFARMPLYPLFVAAVKREAPASSSGGSGWHRITLTQAWIDVLVTGLLAWAMARKLGGRAAGLIALGLAMLWPISIITVGAVLTETLAAALSVAALAPLVLLYPTRPKLAFVLAGAGIGLSLLLRQDGLLLGAALVPLTVVAARASGWKRAVTLAAGSVLAFALVFSPWPIRNLARFGHAYPLGARIDRFSRPIENYAGFWSWLGSWAWDYLPATYPSGCFLDPGCDLRVDTLDRYEAFSDAEPGERAEVARLLAEKKRHGFSREVSDGFEKLAAARRAHHPFRAWVLRPISRAFHMWVGPWDELLGNPRWRPWPQVTNRIMRGFRPLSLVVMLLMMLSAVVLLLDARSRLVASVLVAAITVRTAVLAFAFYVMPRYILEVLPLGFVLIAAAIPLAVEKARALRRPAATP